MSKRGHWRASPAVRGSLWLAAAVSIATLALVAAACGGGGTESPAAGKSCGTTSSSRAIHTPAARVPHFGHVVVVVFENREYGEVIGSSDAPTFNRLARTYAEGLPAPGFTGARAGRYAKKHNPLVYFRDVFSNRRRLARIVPLSQLDRDLAAAALPNFALIVPDLCHDIHDCSVAEGDRWLGAFLPPLIKNPQLRHGVVFVVFDEGDESDDSGGGGHTVALAVGPTVKPGSRSAASLTHYNLLRTIEQGLRLSPLGQSRTARPIADIWR